jgi:hypothetical protein
MAKKKPRAAPPAGLPSYEAVYALPYLARVAFTARLARRLLPLVGRYWERKVVEPEYRCTPRLLDGVRKCVWHAERAAATGHVAHDQAMYDARGLASDATSYTQYAAELAGRQPGSLPYAASLAAGAAFLAGTAGYKLVKPDWNCEFGGVLFYTEEVGKILGVTEPLSAAFVADFETVRRLAAEKGWTDQTPVPPKVFGPLWPRGAPKGWPEEE